MAKAKPRFILRRVIFDQYRPPNPDSARSGTQARPVEMTPAEALQRVLLETLSAQAADVPAEGSAYSPLQLAVFRLRFVAEALHDRGGVALMQRLDAAIEGHAARPWCRALAT